MGLLKNEGVIFFKELALKCSSKEWKSDIIVQQTTT